MSLDPSKFEEKWGSEWHQVLLPLFKSGVMDRIYTFLKEKSRDKILIAPESKDTYKALLLTPPSKMKMVVLGLSPYHSLHNKEIVADGIAMSCSRTGILQPTLRLLYEALEKDVAEGMDLTYEKHPDLSYWCRQGLLMLNAGLTVEIGKAGSHNEIWAPFITHIFKEVIAPSGVPVIFLGREASRFSKLLNPLQHNFQLSHPASVTYSGLESWDSQGSFRKCNQIIEKDLLQTPIDWLKSSDAHTCPF